ncbi:MBL fold metallo-hydrolase [Erysipelothrix sp. HDW6C]|uniref:MBL fold metallo-hydrolase n=1 Tax=Erysipelothrix sp. HDW6C TaxID=2714930 RepID=UPI00140DD4A6|nr:MBL fold metallo-hydrolase [Erysipelothrix sp. HDW6C]QIK68810.1 MBL fold metallo-hydrolase [Erysipelothrix sp. HDW6C]
MKITKLSYRHTIFTEAFAGWDLNLHLIRGNKNNYLIDTGVGSKSVMPILEFLENDAKPLIVINTHYHWDHVFGNANFKNNTIVSHTLCRELIAAEWDTMVGQARHHTTETSVKVLPNLTFDNELQFPEDGIFLFYTPGHTIDGISVYDAVERVMNFGDNLGDNMATIVPDLETREDVYIQTLQEYKKYAIKTAISGHNIIQGPEILDAIIEKISK